MAQVKFATDIASISGKLCKKEGVIYSVNSKTGKTYRSDRHSKNYANTTLQQEVKTAFTKRMATAQTWWKTNKPASDDATPTAEWTAMKKAYNAQSEIGNPWSYVLSKVTKTNTLSFTSDTASEDTEDNTDPNAPEGGIS